MKKIFLFVLPLIAAATLLSGMGKKPATEESSICQPMTKCECSKDCKACAKDKKNCGKEGCTCIKMDKKEMNGKKSEAASKLFVRKPTKEELGKEVTCPVMTNEKFKVSVATPVVDYKGKAYFMCCNGCPQKFMANPEKYAK